MARSTPARSPAREAWSLLRRLMVEGESHARMYDVCAELGLTPGLLKSLFQLSALPPQSMRELAQRFRCDASYVTTLVDSLEEQGLAERRPHPSDRRVRTVVVTERGAELAARARRMLDEPPATFAALDAAEQRQLRDLARKLVAADPLLAEQAAADRPA